MGFLFILCSSDFTLAPYMLSRLDSLISSWNHHLVKILESGNEWFWTLNILYMKSRFFKISDHFVFWSDIWLNLTKWKIFWILVLVFLSFFFFFFNFSLEKSNWVNIQIFFWKKDLILYMHASRGHSNLDTAFESSFFPKNNCLLCYIFSSNE